MTDYIDQSLPLDYQMKVNVAEEKDLCSESSSSDTSTGSSDDELQWKNLGAFAGSQLTLVEGNGAFPDFHKAISLNSASPGTLNDNYKHNNGETDQKKMGRLQKFRLRALKLFNVHDRTTSDITTKVALELPGTQNNTNSANTDENSENKLLLKMKEVDVNRDSSSDYVSCNVKKSSSAMENASSVSTQRKTKRSSFSTLPVVFEEDEIDNYQNNNIIDGIDSDEDVSSYQSSNAESCSLSSCDSLSIGGLLKKGNSNNETGSDTGNTYQTQSMSSLDDSSSFNSKDKSFKMEREINKKNTHNNLSRNKKKSKSNSKGKNTLKEMESELASRFKVIMSLKDVIVKQQKDLKKSQIKTKKYESKFNSFLKAMEKMRRKNELYTKRIHQLEDEVVTLREKVISMTNKLEESNNEKEFKSPSRIFFRPSSSNSAPELSPCWIQDLDNLDSTNKMSTIDLIKEANELRKRQVAIGTSIEVDMSSCASDITGFSGAYSQSSDISSRSRRQESISNQNKTKKSEKENNNVFIFETHEFLLH